ncbi:hypothetical protein IG631_22587 [Alternaria alternata]|nr:hypothetical protein IG631_22587 [Alternaria alternata]
MRLGVEYRYAGIPCADRDAKLVGTTGPKINDRTQDVELDISKGERQKVRRTQTHNRSPQRTTWHDHTAEQQRLDEIALASGTNHVAPVVQPSSSTSPSHSRDAPTMAEYTSPFEDGYALLKGGPAWECAETKG